MSNERRLKFSGLVNFRDLGGYKTKDGKTVKWGKLYRSDGLNSLTDEDKVSFLNLGIKSIFDYRTKEEVDKKPDPILDGTEYVNISAMTLEDGNEVNLDMKDLAKNLEQIRAIKNPLDILGKRYIQMAFGNEAYKKLINYALDEDKYPILQHCAAGKDRTGIGAALLLLAIDVPEETIIEDYLLSQEYFYEPNEAYKKSIKDIEKYPEVEYLLDALMGVRREYIEGFLSAIKDRYESIDEYLETEFGLTKEKKIKLKNMLLE